MRWIILDPNSYNGIQRLSREQKWELLDVIFIYNNTWEIPEMTDMVWMAFDMMRWFFDTQIIKYKEKCDKNKENADKRWHKETDTNISEWIQNDAVASERIKSMPIKSNKIKPNQIKSNEIELIKISSKEDTEKSVVKKKEYWDPIINSIIETIKKHNNGIIDWTIKGNRINGKLLKDKIAKIKWFDWDYVKFISTIIQRTDQYNIWKTTSCESIYYNLASLVAKIKTTHIETKEKEEESKPKTWRLQPTTSLTTT